MCKVVTTKKEHKCAYCERIIPKGSKAYYHDRRLPVYEIKGFEEKQIGIEYYNDYQCFGVMEATCHPVD